MNLFSIIFVAFSTLVAAAPTSSLSEEQGLEQEQGLPPGVMSFQTKQNFRPLESVDNFIKVAASPTSTNSNDLKNFLSFYTVDFQAGTPRQNLSAVIDTGSSDLWIYDKSSGRIPFFDHVISKTFRVLDRLLYIAYGSGPVRGLWANDMVYFNNFLLPNTTFGLVRKDLLEGAPIPGVLGLGRVSNEASTFIYNNIPERLYRDGAIKRNAYSIFLNSLNSETGNILFGGIDTARFSGTLQLVPMTNDTHMGVELRGMSLKYHDKSIPINNTFAENAILDTGSSFTYIPDAAFHSITKAIGAIFNPTYNTYFVPNITENTPSLSFNLGGVNIIVPPVEYILPVRLFLSESPPAPYILTLFKSSDTRGMTLLGANFMRSCYAVFDITGNQMALAQARYDISVNTTIIPIVDSIPGAVKAEENKIVKQDLNADNDPNANGGSEEYIQY